MRQRWMTRRLKDSSYSSERRNISPPGIERNARSRDLRQKASASQTGWHGLKCFEHLSVHFPDWHPITTGVEYNLLTRAATSL